MKKRLALFVAFILVVVLAFTGCGLFEKTVTKLEAVNLDEVLAEYDEIKVDDELDFSGLMVKVNYSDGSFKVVGVADGLEIETPDISKGGTVTVIYKYEGVEGSFTINVVKRDLTSIEIDESTVLKNVIVGEIDEYDVSGLKVTAYYSDGTSRILDAGEYTVSLPDISKAGDTKLSVSFGGKTDEVAVNVRAAMYIEVDASDIASIVTSKDEIDLANLVVTVKYNAGADLVLTADQYTTNIDSLDFTAGGALTVTVTYGALTDTFDIFVKKATGIQLDAEDVELDLTIEQEIDLSALKVYLVYNIGDPVLLESGYTVEELNRNDAATRKIVVSYGDFTAELKVEPATLSGITVTGTVAKVLKGETPDYSNLTVVANFSNGSSKTLALSDVEFSVDTSVAGNTDITVSYEGKTATVAVLVYAPASLEVIGGFVDSVKIDKVTLYNINDLKIRVNYTDGTRREVAFTTNFASLDLTTAGEKTLVVSAEGITLELTINVIGIKSLAISGVPSSVVVGKELDLSAAVITITYTDDTTATVALSECQVDFDGSTVGNKTLTVTYNGVAGTATVVVMENITITGVEFGPAAESDAKKTSFKDQTSNYVVGDDNAFRIPLTVKGMNSELKPVTITTYVGSTAVYLVDGGSETLLDEGALATYAVIDEEQHTIDFTDAAIDKTFRLALGVAGSSRYTSVVVDVEDAFNIYDVKELNYITNSGHFTNRDENGNVKDYYNKEIVNEYLAAHGMQRPENLRGVVFHSDLYVTENDIPATYLYKSGNVVAICDFMGIYAHELLPGESFSIHGNYFTINSYAIPSVVSIDQDSGLNTDGYSNSDLFHFHGTQNVQNNHILPENYDPNSMQYYVNNLAMMDHTPATNDVEEAHKFHLGLIGIKVNMCEATIDNVIAQRYYTSCIPENDYTTVNIVDCNFYNAFSTHLFIWGNNHYSLLRDEWQQAPLANHKPVTVNIVTSDLTKCGGPVVFAQHAYVDPQYKSANDPLLYRESNTQSGVVLNIDTASKLESFVAGTEAWFQTIPGIVEKATSIKDLSMLIEGYAAAFRMPASFAPNNKALTGAEIPMMNLQVIVMADGVGFGSAADVDGIVNVGENAVVNLNDAYGMNNAANPTLYGIQSALIAQAGPALAAQLPIFSSSAGGWGIGMTTNGIDFSLLGVSSGAPGDLGANDAPLFLGDNITLYIMGMGIMLGYYH